MKNTNNKTELLGYLAENYNHGFVEKIAKKNDDERLYEWLLVILKRHEETEKALRDISATLRQILEG